MKKYKKNKFLQPPEHKETDDIFSKHKNDPYVILDEETLNEIYEIMKISHPNITREMSDWAAYAIRDTYPKTYVEWAKENSA